MYIVQSLAFRGQPERAFLRQRDKQPVGVQRIAALVSRFEAKVSIVINSSKQTVFFTYDTEWMPPVLKYRDLDLFVFIIMCIYFCFHYAFCWDWRYLSLRRCNLVVWREMASGRLFYCKMTDCFIHTKIFILAKVKQIKQMLYYWYLYVLYMLIYI